jgi:hypothetical protein
VPVSRREEEEEETILGLLVEATDHGWVDEALELAVLSSDLWFEFGSLERATVSLDSIVDRACIRTHVLRARAAFSCADRRQAGSVARRHSSLRGGALALRRTRR